MIPKPKHCGENWLKMSPAEGGRICGNCKKVIRDFSQSSWQEIERVQQENNYAVCGMYSKRQLHNWEQRAVTKKSTYSTPLLLATTTVCLLQTEVDQATAQVPTAQFASKDSTADPLISTAPGRKASQAILLYGKVLDQQSKEPLAGTHVLVKNTSTGVACNQAGEFSLEVEQAGMRPPLLLVFSFIGYVSKEVAVSDTTTSPLTVELEPSTDAIYFYVEQPSFFKRMWWKVKNLFRK